MLVSNAMESGPSGEHDRYAGAIRPIKQEAGQISALRSLRAIVLRTAAYPVRRMSRYRRQLARHLAKAHWRLIQVRGAASPNTFPTDLFTLCADYYKATNSGMAYREVEASERVKRVMPRGLPQDHWRFRSLLTWDTTPGFVAAMDGARVAGMPPAVISPEGALIGDLSATYGYRRPPSEHPVFLNSRLATLKSVSGTVAVLASRSANNYYHFVLECLPRLHLLAKAGYNEVDYYWVPQSSPFQAEYLSMLGIPGEKVLDPAMHPHVTASPLIVPSLPDENGQPPEWSVRFLRRRLLPMVEAAPRGRLSRRFYIRRHRGTLARSVSNEKGLLAYLASHDVEPLSLEAMPVVEQIQLFAQAELIVAPHGAGLTNLVFANPTAVVVELFAPSYVNTTYWAIANLIGCSRYFYVLGEGRQPRPGRDLENVRADISVDVSKLRVVLEEYAGL